MDKKFEMSIAISGESTTTEIVTSPEVLSSRHPVLFSVAIGCCYLSLGQATIYFPQSFIGSPSRKVIIDLVAYRPLLRSGDSKYFPIQVDWRVWHKAVVPILSELRIEGPIKRKYLTENDFGSYVMRVEGLLQTSYREKGYMP